MEGFFHLLRLTLRNADRQNLPSMIKSIFAFFLDVFDLRHRLQKRDVDQDVGCRITVSVDPGSDLTLDRLSTLSKSRLLARSWSWSSSSTKSPSSLSSSACMIGQ